MTDYKEEQISEIEALEAIFPSEIEVLETEPFHVFTVSLQSDEVHEEIEECDSMATVLKFTYTERYPDELPIIEIESSENLEEEDEEKLLELLQEEGSINLGTVMVFTLVSFAIDWLKQHAENTKKRKVMEEENRKIKEEEEEMKKFDGVKVTIESFLAWKANFDAELAEMKKLQAKLEKGTEKKLTGREQFENDKTLNESDLQFLQEGEEEVKVDESLFQELEGLDIDVEEIGEDD